MRPPIEDSDKQKVDFHLSSVCLLFMLILKEPVTTPQSFLLKERNSNNHQSPPKKEPPPFQQRCSLPTSKGSRYTSASCPKLHPCLPTRGMCFREPSAHSFRSRPSFVRSGALTKALAFCLGSDTFCGAEAAAFADDRGDGSAQSWRCVIDQCILYTWSRSDPCFGRSPIQNMVFSNQNRGQSVRL